MKKKIIALLLTIVTVASLFCGCSVEKEKTVATPSAESVKPSATASPETGNEVAVTIAGIDIDNIKAEDKVSVFTVKSVDIKKNDSGAVTSAEIIFTGKLAVRGTYGISEDGSCFFAVSDEYKEFIPYPKTENGDIKGFYVDVTSVHKIYGDKSNGTAAIVIEEYTLSYGEKNGEWKASVGLFAKEESEYAIMQ